MEPGVSKPTAEDLVECEHHEIIDGVMVPKAGAAWGHGLFHGEVLVQVSSQGFRRGGCWRFAVEPIVEFTPEQIYLPDIAGWRLETMPEPMRDQVKVTTRPDWVCELLSPSTAARDLGHKQRFYHRAGVKHLWIVHPEYRLLVVYRWTEAGYLLIQAAGPGELVRAEPFEAVDLAIFGM